MRTRASWSSWWRPLPTWLKLATVIGAYPAWIFIIYCIVKGQAKSPAALLAFAIFAFCAVLHIIFDDRNRLSRHETSGGLELTDGGE